jgi:NAD(P)-dependent dehydrogenase (short-subunit alcohol dehydrogenase family)
MAVRPGFPGSAPYTAAKGGILQLVRTAAIEYGPLGITCNAILPGLVNSPLMNNPLRYGQLASGGDAEKSGREFSLEDALPGLYEMNAMPIPWIEPEDIAEAVVYLCCESGRYVTGAELEVSGGFGLTTFTGGAGPPAA